MNTATARIDAQESLFDAPTDTTPTRPRPTGATVNPAHPAGHDNPQAPFDPSRWVVVGWRDAKDSPFTPGQILAVLSHHTTQGPCARCGTPHHRYGEGGAPLCPACRAPSTTEE